MAQKISLRSWKNKRFQQRVGGILIVLVIAGLGIYLLRAGHAASPYATSEAEKGTLSSSACLGTNSSDSNGSHVQFGNCTASTVGTSANNIIIWNSCGNTESLSNAQLAAYKAAGVGGFTCGESQLFGMGNDSDEYTSNLSDPNLASTSTNSNYSVERGLISTNIAARAHAAGLKIYLGTYMVNYYNTQTPLEEWFNDAAWTNTAIPDFTNLAGAAHALGFDGIALDGEMYTQTGGVNDATWGWNYTGNTHTQAQTNTEVVLRGQQIMTAINAAFPNVKILDYYAKTGFPNTWDAYIQQVDNGATDAYANAVFMPFWDGMTSVSGYGDIYFLDPTFYKGPNISGATSTTLANALQYNANSWYADISTFSNPAYAADHVAVTPFIWIDGDVANEGTYATPLSVSSATSLMDTYTQWGMDGLLADYTYAPFSTYDYSPFYPLFETIAKQTIIDTSPPTLTVSAPSSSSTSTTSSTINMSGSSIDNFAVRAVKWTNSKGGSGAAVMTWQAVGSYMTTYNTTPTNWTIAVPLQSGTNTITITAEDIHGLTTSKVITVTH